VGSEALARLHRRPGLAEKTIEAPDPASPHFEAAPPARRRTDMFARGKPLA
jgi:hypothetical protein